MKKVILTCLFICNTVALAQLAIGGIIVPNTLVTNETALVINGAGIREKYLVNIYVGVLYLKAKSNDAQMILNADEPMALKLHIISSKITSEKMMEALDEGFKKATGGNISPLLSKINQFKAVFKEKIKIGDIYDIIYEPVKGLVIHKNSKLLATIPGHDFKKALFGIWLCNQPADESFKQKLLGK